MHGKISRIEIRLSPDGLYRVQATKRWDTPQGRREITIGLDGAHANAHYAVDAAKGIVTMSPSDPEDFARYEGGVQAEMIDEHPQTDEHLVACPSCMLHHDSKLPD